MIFEKHFLTFYPFFLIINFLMPNFWIANASKFPHVSNSYGMEMELYVCLVLEEKNVKVQKKRINIYRKRVRERKWQRHSESEFHLGFLFHTGDWFLILVIVVVVVVFINICSHLFNKNSNNNNNNNKSSYIIVIYS